MMLRRFAFFFVLIVASTSLPLAGFEVQDVSFFPPRFYVGDQVEAVLQVSCDDAARLREPQQLPQSQWVEYHRVRLLVNEASDSAEVHLSFTAYVPGTVSLPLIDLGAGAIKDYEILVHSLQPQYGSELREIRPQMLIPGTQLTLWTISALLLLLPALWLASIHYGETWLKKVKQRVLAGRPYRRLRAGLRRIVRAESGMQPKVFYIELLTVLRQYFSEKTDSDCMSATTHELHRILAYITDDAEAVRILQEIFYFGDLVKFAGADASPSLQKTHVAQVYTVVARIEQKEAHIPVQVVEYADS